MPDKKPSRDDYYRTCIGRGVPKSAAASIADGLILARERQAQAVEGWGYVVHRLPRSIKEQAVLLLRLAMKSIPSEDPVVKEMAAVESSLTIGIFVGMALAGNNHPLSEHDVRDTQGSMPELWEWIEELNAEKAKRDDG